MQLIRGLHNLKSQVANGCVATIGNYDGVHLGHQEIIKAVKEKSSQLKLPSVVVIFEPQPGEFFAKDRPSRLTSLCEKIFLLKQYDIDYLLVLPFNSHLVGISASQFIINTLVNLLKVKHLVVGDDFVFGHNREGDFELLKQVAEDHDFQVDRIDPFKVDGVRVSSTLIRSALYHDNLNLASRLLGRRYSLFGKVVSGDRRGRDMGFRTANIRLKRHLLLLSGVYVVKVSNLGCDNLYGLANVGFRPTVYGKIRQLEVYIFDFNHNIYGESIKIEFCKKLRDEIKFDSLSDLTNQIEKDVIEAREYLG